MPCTIHMLLSLDATNTTTTTTVLRPFVRDYPVSQYHSGFCWSRHDGVAVASAEPYASYLYFAPEDNHASTLSVRFLWAGCLSGHPTKVSKHWRPEGIARSNAARNMLGQKLQHNISNAYHPHIQPLHWTMTEPCQSVHQESMGCSAFPPRFPLQLVDHNIQLTVKIHSPTNPQIT